jgi:hypothetical protein
MTLSITEIITKLPRTSLQAVAISWRNAVGVLIDPDRQPDHQAATTMIEAIHEEWDRRRDQPPRAGDLVKDWKEDEAGRRPESPLSAHGYKVGRRSNMPRKLRQEILRRCVDEPLMPVFIPTYLADWGRPRTVRRLQKVLALIDAQIRPNTTQADKQDAVAEWRADIGYLKDLYADKVDIRWPPSDVRAPRFVGE